MIFKCNLEIFILCDETLDCIEPSVPDVFWPCSSMKSEGTASFPRWKETFHVSHSAFIDNHSGGGSLLLPGRDGSSAPHVVPLTTLGSGVGRLTTHYCWPQWKPGFTPLGFLWHHPWRRRGWLFPARERCKSRLPCGLLGHGARWRQLLV